ncbi:hypothetical protein CFIMG_004621RA [Ceratocystis fimbriata CBS 114723]|uniref:Uncharacterized protein n=1 Tax=Ceratocystis fimbriata CBS 114723 TaxID=1035309 RepID=A0A2C5WZ44_9PEZI|nr:hypothetical protein CFIMG_004621RA [Ceratocystis fimbriata CBS 114723]
MSSYSSTPSSPTASSPSASTPTNNQGKPHAIDSLHRQPIGNSSSASVSSSSNLFAAATSTFKSLSKSAIDPVCSYTAKMEYGLNSPGMETSRRPSQYCTADGMTLEAEKGPQLIHQDWNPNSLSDPFNRPEIPPLRAIKLSPEKEAEHAAILAAAKERARELDKSRQK